MLKQLVLNGCQSFGMMAVMLSLKVVFSGLSRGLLVLQLICIEFISYLHCGFCAGECIRGSSSQESMQLRFE